MVVLPWGIFAIFTAFAAHVLIWRIAPPKKSAAALLGIFVGVFLALAGLSLVASLFAPGLADYLPSGIFDYGRVAVFYFALMCGYIMTYPAIEVESPSLSIVNMMAKAGPEGLLIERLYAELDDDALLWPRVNDLLNERALILNDGRYQLTPNGRFIMRVFAILRQAMGALDKGG